jgi:hypothetical protein
MSKQKDQGKSGFQDTRIIGIILLAIGVVYTFSAKRQFYESLVWYGLGIFLLARYDPEKDVRFTKQRRIIMWVGGALAVGAFIYELVMFILKLTSTANASI